MPIKLYDLERFASNLGFYRSRQKGSHVRWKHPDGRATTIPVYSEISGWLLNEILHQLGVTKKDWNIYQQPATARVSQLVK